MNFTVILSIFNLFVNHFANVDLLIYHTYPMTQKIVIDASLINTQHYKVRIKGKLE